MAIHLVNVDTMSTSVSVTSVGFDDVLAYFLTSIESLLTPYASFMISCCDRNKISHAWNPSKIESIRYLIHDSNADYKWTARRGGHLFSDYCLEQKTERQKRLNDSVHNFKLQAWYHQFISRNSSTDIKFLNFSNCLFVFLGVFIFILDIYEWGKMVLTKKGVKEISK